MSFHSSILIEAFCLTIIAIVCSCNGSIETAVEMSVVAKRLRSFDPIQVLMLVDNSKWSQENSLNQNSIKPRMLEESCDQKEFDLIKKELIDSLYKAERKVRYLRRAAFGSLTCRFQLKKAFKRVPKIAKLISKNDFGHAWRKVKSIILLVKSCGAALDNIDGNAEDLKLKAASDSLDKFFKLTLKAGPCYYYLYTFNLDSPSLAPSVAPSVAPDSAPDSSPDSAPDSSPDSAPDSSPYSSPYFSPYSSPYFSPYSPPDYAPYSDRISAPDYAPYSDRFSAPDYAPYSDRFSAPDLAPDNEPVFTPASGGD